MRLVPKGKREKIDFFASRIRKWAQDPAAVGLDAEAMAQLLELLADAEAAAREQRDAIAKARSATVRLDSAVARLCSKGGKTINRIRAYMPTAGGSTYAIALIPPVKKQSRLAEPGTPTGITHTLENDGSLTIRWKCRQPAGAVGTTYEIRRRIDRPMGSGRLEHVATVGDKQFQDVSLPMGTANVRYQIQAKRSKRTSGIAEHHVQFGGGFSRMFQRRAKKVVAVAPSDREAA